MQNNVPTTTSGTLVLADGTPVTIRVNPAEELPPTPQGDERVRIVLDIDPGVADMESVGEAVMTLLRAGETMARQSRAAADRLDATVAAVEAARATGRDW